MEILGRLTLSLKALRIDNCSAVDAENWTSFSLNPFINMQISLKSGLLDLNPSLTLFPINKKNEHGICNVFFTLIIKITNMIALFYESI